MKVIGSHNSAERPHLCQATKACSQGVPLAKLLSKAVNFILFYLTKQLSKVQISWVSLLLSYKSKTNKKGMNWCVIPLRVPTTVPNSLPLAEQQMHSNYEGEVTEGHPWGFTLQSQLWGSLPLAEPWRHSKGGKANWVLPQRALTAVPLSPLLPEQHNNYALSRRPQGHTPVPFSLVW